MQTMLPDLDPHLNEDAEGLHPDQVHPNPHFMFRLRWLIDIFTPDADVDVADHMHLYLHYSYILSGESELHTVSHKSARLKPPKREKIRTKLVKPTVRALCLE